MEYGQALSSGNAADPFEISVGVTQGCVLPHVLFNLPFTRMPAHVVRDLDWCTATTVSTEEGTTQTSLSTSKDHHQEINNFLRGGEEAEWFSG